MPRRADNNPTDAELQILRVIWEHGPSTVRFVHESLNPDGETRLTTTLKLIQIMTDKGILKREPDTRPAKYRPAQSEARIQRQLLKDLLTRAFGGSTPKLLSQLLEARKCSSNELDEIRSVIDDFERDKG